MKKVASIKTASLTVKAANTEQAAHLDTLQRVSESSLLQLHQQLQTTLNTGTLINRFFGWLGENQIVGGIEYIHPDENIRLSSGSPKNHQAHYVMRLEKRYLGEITITSQKRFTDQDLFSQEQSMGVLVHYLKNSIDHQALEKVAFHDSLTGVMNRTALDELLPKETKRAQRYGYDLSVIMIDIDYFKSINDRIGHTGGDAILRLVSKAIKEQLRNSDLPFRYGGDEFLLVLPNTDLSGAHQAANQIMNALKAISTTPLSGKDIIPQLSVGAASYQQGESHEDLIRRADNALDDAKKSGRNCIC